MASVAIIAVARGRAVMVDHDLLVFLDVRGMGRAIREDARIRSFIERRLILEKFVRGIVGSSECKFNNVGRVAGCWCL